MCDDWFKSSKICWNDDNEKKIKFSVDWDRLKLSLTNDFTSFLNWLIILINCSDFESFEFMFFIIFVRLRDVAMFLLSRVLIDNKSSFC